MTVHTLQANMTRGEATPYMHARVDTDHYQAALEVARNWIVLRYGGVTRVPGALYDGQCKSEFAYLLPFEFNRSQVYAIEVGALYFRFWTPLGRIEVASVPVEVVTPYALADIPYIRMRQSGDVLYLTCRKAAGGAYQPQTLTRVSETNWVLAPWFPKNGPFLTEDTKGTKLTPAARGSITPEMTSNILPSGTAASDTASANAFKVFDMDPAQYYSVADIKGWLSFTFGGGIKKVADGYWVQADPEPLVEAPTAWTFEAYDGVDWVVLDTRSSETNWIAGERRYFGFPNETAYEAYRFKWTASQASGALTQIAEIAIHEAAAFQTAFNLTASSVNGINGNTGFQTGDVGRVIELTGSDGIRRTAEIIARTSTTVVTVRLDGQALPDKSPIVRWRLGAWGNLPGWPSAIAIYEDRMTMARTNADPLGGWSSVNGDYDNFGVSTPVVDDDAVSWRLTGGKLNDIGWLVENRDIVAGTAGSLRAVGRNDAGRAYSPSNVRQRQETIAPSSLAEPLEIENVMLFIDFYEQRLYEAAYTYETEGYLARETSTLSEHLFRAGVRKLVYVSHPHKIVFVLRYDGKLIAFTYDREQKVAGATLVDYGDDFDVVDIIALPGLLGTQLWMTVRRTVNGVTRCDIQRMAEFWVKDTAGGLPVYATSAVVYDGGGDFTTDTMTVPHLVGKTVGVWADGCDYGDAEVPSDGVLGLGQHFGTVVVGERYNSRLKTLRLSQIGNQDGTGLGRKVNILEAGIDLFETAGLKVGTGDMTDPLYYDGESEEVPYEAKPLQTGMFALKVDDSYSNNGQLTVETDTMYPATVRAVRLEVDGEP